MTEVVKTIKACHIKDGMRIRHDRGAYTVEGDVKSTGDCMGWLVDVTFECDGDESSYLVNRTADVDVLRMPVPKEPKNPGAVVKRTNCWGETAYFVRVKVRDALGHPWRDTKVCCEYPWSALTDDGDCNIEVLSEGVNIDG